jgi:hypothetical protein
MQCFDAVRMERLIVLLADLVGKNGQGDERILTRNNGSPTLPGFYEQTTEWDFIVMRQNRIVAVIRVDTMQDSAADNEHQRTTEAVYAAHSLQAAYRCGMFGEMTNRPFVGWLMLVEDAPGSRSPVSDRSPHFPVRPEFQNASYLQRYDLLCRKLMQENLYTAASVITSPATAARNGKFAEVSELTGLKNFITTFAAHIAAEVAR